MANTHIITPPLILRDCKKQKDEELVARGNAPLPAWGNPTLDQARRLDPQQSSIIRPSLPIMKPKLSATYSHHRPPPPLLSRPLLLIVPETTDGNCERKHVNIAGVMAQSSVEQRSSPPSQGSDYNMKRSKAFRKQPLCVRSDSCQDPTHRSINMHTHT
ncbi:unnamed protein product [Scomber scombrus]|uniref:Unnamed protein product n=1 Tax=Scomber scombrus TaxID=13677 RepID=A0AAV1PKJ1_SCOSC